MTKLRPYNKARKTFLTLFILSTSLFLILFVIGRFIVGSGGLPSGPPPSESSQSKPSLSEQVVTIGGLVTVLTSCVTSIVSFVGFLSTLMLGWRKEVRESKMSALDKKRLEIELEKQKIELSKLRSDGDAEQKDHHRLHLKTCARRRLVS